MSINNTQPIQFLDFIEYPVFSGRQDYHGCTTDLKRLNSIVAKFTNEDFIWDLVNMTDKDKIVETLLSWENKEELDKVLLAVKCDLNVPSDIKNNPKLQTTESAVAELYREWLRLQMTDTVHFDLISLHGGEREEDLTLETLDTDLFDAHYAYNCRNKEFKAYWQEILLSLLLTYYWQKLELQRNIISFAIINRDSLESIHYTFYNSIGSSWECYVINKIICFFTVFKFHIGHITSRNTDMNFNFPQIINSHYRNISLSIFKLLYS